MLYDSYVEQVKKLATIKNKIIKFKIPIIIVFSMIFCFITFVISTKGIITSDLELSPKYNYGDVIEPESSALFSRVYYEYSEKGKNNWTRTVPKLAGEYDIRVVSKKSFGRKGYSKISTFVIEPISLDVYVNESIITYGNLPTVSGRGLINGDTILCSSFTYEDLTRESTTVIPNLEDIIITDKDGNDVTSCYNMTLNESQITFNQRSITITISSDVKTYDGYELTSSEYEITSGTLAYDDEVKIIINSSITNVGSCDNIPSSITICNDENIVTNNYDVNIKKGKLSVEKRNLTITTNNQTYTYDGKLKSSTYTSEGLVNGHHIEVIEKTEKTDVGNYSNIVNVKVLDNRGNDLTDNYNLIYNYGTLTINQRLLEVVMEDEQKIYDGSSLTSSNYHLNDDNQLLLNHKVNVVGTGIQTDAGTSINNAKVNIYNEEGKDVTKNYKVEVTSSNLNITQRPIKLEIQDNSKIYDGEVLETTYDIVVEGKYLNLVEGQILSVFLDTKLKDSGISEFALLAGEYVCYFKALKIKYNNKDVTSNYLIETNEALLTIEKRYLKINMISQSKVYDADELYTDTYDIIDGSVVDGQKLKAKSISIYNVNESSKYYQNDVEYNIYNNYDVDVTSSYSIVINEFELEITQRQIKIVLLHAEEIYKDDVISHKEYVLSTDEGYYDIVEGQELEVKTKTYQDEEEVDAINVGTYINKIVSYFITSEDKDVTSNYSIKTEDSYILIHKREIVLGPYDEIWEYDGTSHLYDKDIIDSTDLGHSILYSNWTNVKYVGIYDNFVNIEIIKNKEDVEEEEDVTNNYDIIYNVGILQITPRIITISTEDLSKVYDDIVLTNIDKKYSITYNGEEKSLGKNDELKIYEDTITSIFNVWESGKENKFEFYIYSNVDKKDITENYEITYNWGTLEIIKRDYIIGSYNQEWEYDGTYHSYDKDLIETTDLEGHTISYSNWTKIKYVGTYENKYTIQIFKGVSEEIFEVTDNYLIDYLPSTLEITKRKITISTENLSKEYNSTPLLNSEKKYSITHECKNENSICSDILGCLDEIIIRDISFITYVDETGELNSFDFYIYNNEDDKIVTYNYEIDYDWGTLEITKRTITISTETLYKVYDGYELKNVNKEYSITYNEVEKTLGYNDELVIDDTTISSITYVDESGKDNIFEFYIYSNVDKKDITENYEITYDWGTLTILKRQFTISLDNKVKTYDKTPLYTSNWTEDINNYQLSQDNKLNVFGLAKTDTLYVKSNEITYVKESGTFTQNDVTYYINHSNGDNTISNYEFIINDYTLEILKRDLTFKPQDDEKIYDSTELTASSWEYVNNTSLASDDYLEVKYSGSIVNVGEVESKIEIYRIYDNNNTLSLEDNYNVITLNGKLKITSRPIKIILEDKTVTYNDTIITSSNYKLSSNEPYLDLVLGQTLTFKSQTYQNDIKVDAINAGEYINKVLEETIKITSLNGDYVTKNYHIDTVNSTITIKPRPITIGPYNQEWEYDGTYHSYDKDLIETTDLGHIIRYSNWAEIKYVGTCDNTFTINIYKDDEDITINYNITYSGTLIISKRNITISTDNLSKEYDNTILTNVDKKYYLSKELGQNDELIIKEDTITSIIYVIQSGKSNSFEFNIYSNKDGFNVTENYEFTYVWGKLEISKRTITVNIESNSWVYDSEEHSHQKYELTKEGGLTPLAQDDKAVVAGYSWIEDVGDTDNAIDIKIKDVDEASIDRTDNYQITYFNGTLTITKCDLTIKPKESYIEYDGYSHNIKDYEATNLGKNDSLEISSSLTKAYVSDNENGNTNKIVGYFITREGKDVSGNYNITLESSIFEIVKRNITIAPMDKDILYDGKSHNITQYIIKIGSIADNEVLNITTSLTKTYVSDNDKYGNENEIIEWHLYHDNIEVTSNYEVTCKIGHFEIVAKNIEITPEDAKKEYDGTPLTSSKGKITQGYLCDGDKLQDIESLSITYVDESLSDNVATKVVILNSHSEDVTSSYEILFGKGNLSITACTIFVETGSASKAYDGTPLTNPNFVLPELYSSNIIEEGKTTGSIIDPGEVENTFEADVYNSEGKKITNCYIFKGTGVLIIFKENEDTPEKPDSNDNLTNNPIALFDVISSTPGQQYLKVASYVNYDGTDNFSGNVLYPGLGNEMTFISRKLYDIGFETSTIEVFDSAWGLSPYYTLSSSASLVSKIYTFLQYSYKTNPYLTTDVTSDYTQFVYDNYLGIDTYTKEELLKVWYKNYTNESYSNYDIIYNVRNLVQGYIPYSLEYDSGLDYNGNCAVYFFNGAKSALCRHYATAAVMMLRALGIPARYTVGYLTDSLLPNNKTTVYNTQGHAWVEVFVDKMGWINLEVTGSSDIDNNNGNDDNGNNNITNESIILTIEKIYSQYSGQSRYLDLEKEIKISYFNNTIYTFKIDKVKYEDIPINVGEYKVSFDDDTDENGVYKYIHIYDSSGNDITADVIDKIQLNDEDGKIIIYESIITITSSNKEKTYDGTLLNSPYCDKEGNLNEGHILEYSNFASILTPGTKDNTFDYIIKDSNGIDVTGNYLINCIYGTLIIHKIKITIKTESAKKTYDGTSLYCKKYTISEGTILDSHELKLVYFRVVTYPSESYANDLLFKVCYGSLDVTETLYEIHYDYGYLEISGITLIIQSKSDSKTYNGTKLYNKGYDIYQGCTVNGDIINVINYSSITNVGTIENQLEFSISNSKGEILDDYDCYNIILINGYLIIKPAIITITSASDSKEYDTYELTNNSGSYNITSDITMAFDIFIDYNCTGSITNPGSTKNIFNPIIKSIDGDNITNNFEITKKEGTLEVTAIIIDFDLYFKNYAMVYADKEASYTKLIKGYNIDSSKYTYTITYTKELLNEEGTYDIVSKCIKPGTYKITPAINIYYIDKTKDEKDYVDVTDILFTVKESSGTLEITKRSIEITTGSLSCQYDGNEHYNHTLNITSKTKLVSGHSFTCKWLTTLVNITSEPIANEIDNIKIFDVNGDDVTDCYDMTVVTGTIEIYV